MRRIEAASPRGACGACCRSTPRCWRRVSAIDCKKFWTTLPRPGTCTWRMLSCAAGELGRCGPGASKQATTSAHEFVMRREDKKEVAAHKVAHRRQQRARELLHQLLRLQKNNTSRIGWWEVTVGVLMRANQTWRFSSRPFSALARWAVSAALAWSAGDRAVAAAGAPALALGDTAAAVASEPEGVAGRAVGGVGTGDWPRIPQSSATNAGDTVTEQRVRQKGEPPR